MTEKSIEDEARARFGDEQTDEYITLMRALRSLVAVWRVYILAPSGSPEEAVASHVVTGMMQNMEERPKHAVALVEALLAVVQHMRMGGSYEAWFESMGISAEPGKGDEHE